MISLASTHRPADRELEQRVQATLQEQHIPSARRVRVYADDGVVTIQGQVRSFYLRQLCSACCRRTPGVTQVVDEIVVEDRR